MTTPGVAGSNQQVHLERPGITYKQAEAARAAGQEIYRSGRIWPVRRPPSMPGQPAGFWIADEQTRSDHTLRLYRDGRMEAE
jgi:hypothetical protein